MTPKAKATVMTEETNTASANMTLEEALKKVRDLEAIVGAKDAYIEDVKKEQECFLVLTANPAYNGKTAGISFVNGMAIIPYNQVYPAFENPSGDKPSSQRMVEFLCADFGYTYEFYDRDHQEELNKRIEERKTEKDKMEKKLEETGKMLEKLIQAHRFG